MLIQPLGTESGSTGYLHEPFLERAQRHDVDQRSALAGFLTLRLVDQFAANRAPLHPDAIAHQCTATGDFLSEFDPPEAEVNHLSEIVRLAQAVRPSDVRLLWAPLLAYAHWLERELRLDEALDVLDTTMRLSGDGMGEEVIACWLQRGRTLRRMGRFDHARESYEAAGTLAAERGDTHSELLSRIGRGIVLERRGNLPASEQMLREALADAKLFGDQDAEARATHDLANTLGRMGRAADAVPLMFRAFLTYDERLKKLRALSDLGVIFKELGRVDAAENAFSIVVTSDVPRDMRVTTMLELIETSIVRRNQLAFERWRRAAEPDIHTDPYLAVDYHFKVARGYSQLVDDRQRSITHLQMARAVAEEHDLNQFAFEAERMLDSLERGGVTSEPQPQEAPDAHRHDVTHVADRVRQLRLEMPNGLATA